MSAPDPGFPKEESVIFYRAFSRALDSAGRVIDRDFALRLEKGEVGLSVALSPEKAMGDLRCRGYAALTKAQIEQIGLTLRMKTGPDNPTGDEQLWEIVGIPLGTTQEDEDARTSYSIALADAAGKPVLVPGRR